MKSGLALASPPSFPFNEHKIKYWVGFCGVSVTTIMANPSV